MGRAEDYALMGNIIAPPKVVDPLLKEAYANEEDQIWHGDLFSSPHGSHWSTSFHSSQFPGDPDTACPRKAMYSFMNIPGPKPVDRNGRAVMEAGLDIEDRIVWRFHRAGILLSEPPDSKHQTNFQSPEHWLSGNSDAIIRVPRKNSPHCVEVKTKYQKALDEMKNGERSYDPQHKNQIMCYIGFCHDYGHLFWPDLDPCDSGTLLYVSRDNPSITYEFQFEYDPDWWKLGLDTLLEWQQYFLKGELPPRPEHFMWSKGTCQYCNFKRDSCKPDWKDEITELDKSHGIEWAKKVYGDYDYEEQRQTVIDRWIDNG